MARYCKLVFVVIVFCILLATASASPVTQYKYFWDIEYYNGKLPNQQYISALKGTFTSPFGNNGTITGVHMEPRHISSYIHQGVDFAGGGVTVKAVADGIVYLKGTSGSYGQRIVIQHVNSSNTPMEVYSLYAHLNNYNGCPAIGKSVTKGQSIGVSGNTGGDFAPHLHFSIYTKHNGIIYRLYPLKYFITNSHYNRGNYMDYLQKPETTVTSTNAKITVEAAVYSVRQADSKLFVVFRKKGSSWNQVAMTKKTPTSNTTTWEWYIPYKFWNADIEYYIVGTCQRNSISKKYRTTRPAAAFYSSTNDTNYYVSSNPGIYYQCRVNLTPPTPPPINSVPIAPQEF